MENLPRWLFERVHLLCMWGEQRREPKKLDPALKSQPPGSPVGKHLASLESGLEYLLDNPRPRHRVDAPPPRSKRRQRVGKDGQEAFERAREDTIAEIIRSIVRDGGFVTSEAVASKSKGQDGRQIPAGTIRNSKSWRNRMEIAAEARGDVSYLDKYREVGGFTSDQTPLDEPEST